MNKNIKINSNIYGDSSTPVEKDEIYCCNCENCSLYKKGTCYLVRTLGNPECPYGEVITTKGYTKRSSKYNDYMSAARKDPTYKKLSFPSQTMFSSIGDCFAVNLRYVNISRDSNKLLIKPNILLSSISYIPKKDFSLNLLYNICSTRPRTLFGNTEITEYQSQVIPNFLFEIKEKEPIIYNNFIKAYPEFDGRASLLGKQALLTTISPSIVTINKITWEWNGRTLKYISGPILLGGPYSSIVNVEIVPKDDIYVKITEDSQVNERTIFEA